jgi:hypothetical protein
VGGGRSQCGKPDVGPYAHRDHVLGDMRVACDASIEQLLNDVRQVVVDKNSTLMSGYLGSSLASFRDRIVLIAPAPAVVRMVPVGFS